ncbi:hypothetical protein [Niallia endozanthoxylica]|uniref:hypothetical protein n=1 Tax=Niallia endozanthoxylica TaxID=2036016 RepID=UPI00168BD749|nr:hypothetical protein [Niallia endozanthoxylica]
MKRFLANAVSYFITGIGGYYIFSGDVNFYSLTILAVGLSGILYDLFHKKVRTE